MISFIQQTLQKHHKWIFSILLGVIIVAFVFTIGAAPGVVGKRRSAIFYGKNLLSKRDMRSVINAVSISSMAVGIPLYSERQLERAVLARCALLAQADELSIPRVGDNGLLKFLGTLPGFLDDDGKFSDEKYRTFLAMCKQNNMSEAEIRAALLDDQRIDVLTRAVAGNGIAFEYQIERALASLYTEYDLAIAKLRYDSFHPSMEISGDDLQKYYGENLERYRVPEMVAVSIVRFEAEQFRGDVTLPSEEILREYFQAERDQFATYPDFESARSEVAAKYMDIEAHKLAIKKADEFIGALYTGDIALNSVEWQNLLLRLGVKKEKIAAYSKLRLPVVKGVPEAALLEVCSMDPARYYSDPFAADFGAAVLIVEGRKEPHVVPFKEVKKRVKKDLRDNIRMAKFEEKAEWLRKALIDAAPGNISKCFAEFNLVPEFFEKVSLSEHGEKLASEYWNALGAMPKDERVCCVKIGDDTAFVVVLGRNTPDYATMEAKNCGEIENNLRKFDRDFYLSEYVEWLISHGLKKIK